jgi:hypothetical protein
MITSKTALLLTVLTVCAFALGGCPGVSAFQVTYPTNSQNYTVNASDQLVMTVQFNKNVDVGSIIAGTNLYVNTDTISNANIVVTAGSTPNEIVVTTVDTVSTLLTFTPDGFFTLYVSGDGANPVTSQGGTRLDGDGNGVAGGVFQHQYTMLG